MQAGAKKWQKEFLDFVLVSTLSQRLNHWCTTKCMRHWEHFSGGGVHVELAGQILCCRCRWSRERYGVFSITVAVLLLTHIFPASLLCRQTQHLSASRNKCCTSKPGDATAVDRCSAEGKNLQNQGQKYLSCRVQPKERDWIVTQTE